METTNQELISMFKEDKNFFKFLNARSQKVYDNIEKSLLEKHGEEKLKQFNKLIRQELK